MKIFSKKVLKYLVVSILIYIFVLLSDNKQIFVLLTVNLIFNN